MKKLLSRKSLVLLAVVVINIVNALGGIFGNVVSEDIKEILMWAGIFQYRIQITVGLLIIGLLVAAWVFKAEKDERKEETSADLMPESERASREFLADLAGRYQKRNVHKLDRRYMISLVVSDGLEGTHTQKFDEEFGAGAPAGEATQYIIERFERQGRLMIVGNPGSGKTVLMLILAQYLAEKAKRDASQPLPVIFNLNSWSSDYGCFEAWIKAMLTKGYGLSSDFAGRLLREQRIIFLLDGLDELARNEKPERAAEVRAECLASLEKALYDGTISVVICCRSEQLAAMLRRTDTEPPVPVVTIHDLTPVQIDLALIRASHTQRDRFAAPHLIAALGHDCDSIYYQVLSTPFYFTTALQVFDSNKPPRIDAPDRRTLEANLIAGFVQKKLQVTPNTRLFPYSAAKTLAWLTWLAVFLNERVTFELSDLQPFAIKRRWLYKLLFSLFFGVFGGLVIGLYNRKPSFGVSFGVLYSLISVYMITEDFGRWMLDPLRRWRTWLSLLLFGTAGCMMCVHIILIVRIMKNGVIGAFLVSDDMILKALFFTLMMGLIAIVAGMGVRLFIRAVVGITGGVPISSIVTEDFGHWTLAPLLHLSTWRDVLRLGLEGGVAGGTLLGAIIFFALSILYIYTVITTIGVYIGDLEGFILSTFTLILGPIVFGFIGFLVGLVIGILLGFLRACRKTARFVNIHSPYQRLRSGIVFNILQLIVVGCCIFFLDKVVILVNYWRGSQESSASLLFFPALSLILIYGLIGLFRTPLLKHLTLRVCLTLEGAMPLRYADFLDYSTELGILERDGGQWRFRHQILQDYFARRPQDGLAQT